jgi:wyosine [tRNA(Phe)-imidazoG37] synthetase (radical SAM superfamily)
MIAFGPIPSRRLGRSLGINNIPPKSCSYSCVYCQVGVTAGREIEPRRFYDPREVAAEVSRRVERLRERGETIDYLTFVPDGEPTLDQHLGDAIEMLRLLGIPIAVISNGSLLGNEEVRARLATADWVSLKVDAVEETLWRRVDRPSNQLRLAPILDGMLAFAADFAGTLTTETMLVAGLNDGEEAVEAVARFLARLRPATAYLAVPTRPPAEPDVHPAGEAAINRAYQLFAGHLPTVELLLGDEGDVFATTGDAAADLLGVAAVHPMREVAVRDLLRRAGADWSTVETLLASGELRETEYRGQRFYLRRVGS